MLTRTATIVILALSMAACADRTSADPGPKQISEAFAAAYNARDAATVASLYADDAEIMPPDSHPLKGRPAIEALFREKFQQRCAMELRSVASEVFGSNGFDKGEIAVTMTGPDGMPQRVAGTYLAVMKRVGDKWKIAYHMQTVTPE